MIFVKSEDLKYGMRLAKPIYNKTGVLLYERNTRLTLQGIESVKNFGLLGLYILEPAEPVPPMSEEDLDFERFQTMAVFSIREELDNIIAGREPINLKRLANAIITNYGRLDHKITFTQNLRSTTDYVYKHVINTAILCALISAQAYYTPTEQEELVLAALLHDIGKSKIPNEILNKAARLTDEEFAIMKQHSVYGYRILQPKEDLSMEIKLGVLQHHEKMNGKGYPMSVTGDKIDLFARLISVSDIYDALVTERPYKKPFSPRDAVEMIMSMTEELDITVMRCFLESVILYPVGTDVSLSNGETARIVENVPNAVLRPKVLGLTTGKVYDLANDVKCANIIII